MKRREVLGVSVATGALLSEIVAAAPVSGTKSHDSLVAAAADCEARGEVCLQHCLDMTASGEMSMTDCIASIRQMLAGCHAIRALALQKSTFAPRMAAVVHDICRACELQCEKFAATHDVCRDCRDACVRCAQECKRITG